MHMPRLFVVLALSALLTLGCNGDDDSPPDISVDGNLALGSLMALGDGHLQELADHFQMLARTEQARSVDWEGVRELLGASDRLSERALLWFAQPDGTYWSVQEGLAEGNLLDRPYWPRLLAGETVMGDLVVSRATGRSAAIVAVPVRDDEDGIVAVLGSSSYLELLSEECKGAMGLEADQFFYAMDAEPLVGLHSDTDEIFLHPLEEDDPQLEEAILEMLSNQEGEISYSFRGQRRSVLYRKSSTSGWWYAFGVLRD